MNNTTIETLKGRENYLQWRVAIKALLDLEDLWDGVVVLKQDVEVDATKDRKARNKMTLTICSSLYSFVENATSAAELWNILSNTFADKGLSRIVSNLRTIVNTKLENCESMASYLDEIIKASNSLKSIGVDLGELAVAGLLLVGLPDHYKPMIMAIEHSGVEIKVETVKNKLLQEEMPSTSTSNALYTQRKPRKNFKFNNKRSYCSICKRSGHHTSDCRNNRNNRALSVALSAVSVDDTHHWYIDSAASTHMSSNKSMFTNLKNCNGVATAANGARMNIQGKGTTVINPMVMSGENLHVHDVEHIPELTTNLLSVSRIVNNGNRVIFDKNGAFIYDKNGELVVTAKQINGLFQVETTKIAMNVKASAETWHKRMGHLNYKSLNQLQRHSTGIEIIKTKQNDCETCPIGKQTRNKFPKVSKRAENLLEIIHSDICGPLDQSLGGKKYILTMIDDYSRRVFVYFLKTRTEDDILQNFKYFKANVEKQTGKQIKCLRSDNGKEYVGKRFQSFLQENGINHQLTAPYTPEQNGIAERMNRTIMEKVRCMLHETKLPKFLWAEAVNYSVYLINRQPHSKIGMTPQEAWTGAKPNLSHIKIFGTKAMIHIPDQKRRKLDPKAEKGYMVGFDINTKGYRLYLPHKRQVIINRNVSFINEGQFNSFNHSNGLDVVTFNLEDDQPQQQNVTNKTNALSKQLVSNPPS